MAVKVNRNLPIDIIESNILWRLPVKSLLRFRSVQKSWYSFISSPYFINLYLRHHRSNNNNDDNLLLMQYNYDCNRDIVVVNTSSNVLSIFNKPNPRHIYSVVGSANGLVCVYGFNDDISSHNKYVTTEYIGLWNPSLRINKIIYQKRRSWSVHRFMSVKACVGFGFHNQTNDYKVIRFTNDMRTGRLKQVEIYSLSSDSWRSIEVADSWENIEVVDSWITSFYCLKMGVYVSDAALIPNFFGAYCWLAKNSENDEPAEGRIISFDMGDEVFKQMVLPPISDIDDARLFNYKDSLAVLEMPSENYMALSLCYLWVMKEYNDPKSWTKLCKYHAPQCSYISAFMGIILETELVVITEKSGSYRDKVCVFDTDNSQTKTNFTEDICILAKAHYVISFTESLVLLDTKNKRKRTRSN